MPNIKALQQRKADLKNKMQTMLDKAAAGGGFSEDEQRTYNEAKAALASNESLLGEQAELLEVERSLTPVGDSNTGAAAAAGAPSAKDSLRFNSLGENLMAIVRAARDPRHVDQRLFAVASGANEAVPSDGGFLVQKDHASEILKRQYETGVFSSRVRHIGIGANANGLKINAIDETSRATGSRWGGVQSYWVNEADTFTSSKPKFRQIELNLQKLIALFYATDEILSDADALAGVFAESFSEEIGFKLDDAIFQGDGQGKPLGFINSGAVVQVAKDSADSTATVSTKDVLSMWSRLYARSRQNAVWFINQDVESSLYPLTLGSGSLGQILLYTPPGSNGNGTGMLMGRPVIVNEHSSTLGTVGDIVLADLSQYIMIDKGGLKQDSSIHVRFLNDEQTFRMTYRCDGQPWWNKPLTPFAGSNTQSPFITLATRP